ncbi:MAG TPA: hypothetical protein VNZ54_06515, partial [bacterium]|nr:hypothetical protein [bacterium]
GIMVQQGFTSNGFSGTNTIERNTLTRCGALYGGARYGAIDFWANQAALGGTWIVDSLDIESATYEGVEFNGAHAITGVTVSNTQVNSPGTYGIQVFGGTSGSATFTTTTVTAPGSGVGSLNSGTMTLTKDGTDVGW